MSEKLCFTLKGSMRYPSARGRVVFNLRENSLQLTAENLPDPSCFGRDELTKEAYDTYEAWLVAKKGGRLVSAGWLRKLNRQMFYLFFRCSQLSDFEGVIITAQDRLSSAKPTPVVIMEGGINEEEGLELDLPAICPEDTAVNKEYRLPH